MTFFAVGAILGGVAIALSTPVTGPRLRWTLRHKIENYSDQLAAATQQLRDTRDRIVHQGERLVRTAERKFHRTGLRAVG